VHSLARRQWLVDVVVVRLVVEHVEAQVLVTIVGPTDVDGDALVEESTLGRLLLEFRQVARVVGVRGGQRVGVDVAIFDAEGDRSGWQVARVLFDGELRRDVVDLADHRDAPPSSNSLWKTARAAPTSSALSTSASRSSSASWCKAWRGPTVGKVVPKTTLPLPGPRRESGMTAGQCRGG